MSKIKQVLESEATRLRKEDDTNEIIKEINGQFEDITFYLEVISESKLVSDNITRKLLKVRRDILKIQSDIIKENTRS